MRPADWLIPSESGLHVSPSACCSAPRTTFAAGIARLVSVFGVSLLLTVGIRQTVALKVEVSSVFAAALVAGGWPSQCSPTLLVHSSPMWTETWTIGSEFGAHSAGAPEELLKPQGSYFRSKSCLN